MDECNRDDIIKYTPQCVLQWGRSSNASPESADIHLSTRGPLIRWRYRMGMSCNRDLSSTLSCRVCVVVADGLMPWRLYLAKLEEMFLCNNQSTWPSLHASLASVNISLTPFPSQSAVMLCEWPWQVSACFVSPRPPGNSWPTSTWIAAGTAWHDSMTGVTDINRCVNFYKATFCMQQGLCTWICYG